MSATATTEKPTKPLPSAEDFFGKDTPKVKGGTSDFLKKFAADQREGLEKQGIVPKEDATRVVDPKKSIVDDNDEPEPDVQEDRQKHKGSFVKNKIEENRALKAEKAQLAQEKESADTTIADLKKQISEATNAKEDKALREELNRAIEERTSLEVENKKKIDALQAKVSFRDIQEDPIFIRDNVLPIRQAHQEIVEAISGDSEAMHAFEQVKAANNRVFATRNEEERKTAEQQLRTAREELSACVPEFEKAEVNSRVKDLINASKKYNKALINWQEEKTRIEKVSKESAEQGRARFLETWKTSYKAQGEAIEADTTIETEVADYMKENGIEFDLSRDERVALIATSQAEGESTPDETNRLIQQGRVFSKNMATIKALKGMLKEKDDYIASLKGTSGRVDAPRKKLATETNDKPEGLSGFLKGWGAGRAR